MIKIQNIVSRRIGVRCGLSVVALILMVGSGYMGWRVMAMVYAEGGAVPASGRMLRCNSIAALRKLEAKMDDPVVKWWRRRYLFPPQETNSRLPGGGEIIGQEFSSHNLRAIVGFAAIKDQVAAATMKRVLHNHKNLSYSWVYIWAVFWIERDDSIPFLFECLDHDGEARRDAAIACLQRRSFNISPDVQDEAEVRAFWSQWREEFQNTTWDDRLIDQLHRAGVDVRRDVCGRISLETLLDAGERFPLFAVESGTQEEALRRLDRETLLAMRISELLCERTGLDISPWCFPLGYPDKSWLGPSSRTGRVYETGDSFDKAWREAIGSLVMDDE